MPSPGRQRKQRRGSTLAPARTCAARLHHWFVPQMPSSIGSTPRTRNAWQAALPQSGISLTLLSWRGSGYRPNLPLFGLSTSASAEHGAALWAWRCKTVLVSALATNFSNSIFPDDSFSLSHSFLLIVFFFSSALPASSAACTHFLSIPHAHTHARARSCTHTHTHTHSDLQSFLDSTYTQYYVILDIFFAKWPKIFIEEGNPRTEYNLNFTAKQEKEENKR